MNDHWQKVLLDNWQIDTELTRLDGEYDLNFLAQGENDFILKVMRPGCALEFIDMQCKALNHINRYLPAALIPKVVCTVSGDLFTSVFDEEGNARIVWLMNKIEGKTYACFNPHSRDLIRQVGAIVGAIDKAWQDFNHSQLARDFKWNLTAGDWIAGHLREIGGSRRRVLLGEIIQNFTAIKPALAAMPNVAIHNDVNDYNIIVDGSLTKAPCVSGIIDLGDMCASPRICDLAIAAAYVVLGHSDPEQALVALVSGYHGVYPLSGEEIDLIWPLLRMRLAVSVVNSTLMAIENPDDPYVVISQKPIWGFLENNSVNTGLINARLRAACGLPVTDTAPRILKWLNDQRGDFALVMGEDLGAAPMGSLSIENSVVPQNPFDLTAHEAATLGRKFQDSGQLWLGYYNEPRLIYTSPAFIKGRWKASDRRTVHLAVDAFAPAGTSICAPLEASVHAVENRLDNLDYGGLVILRHETADGDVFFTLYGHLNPKVCETLHVGQAIAKGEPFARLGDVEHSGGWMPHLHFQLTLTMDGMDNDLPGVADPDEMYLWRAICPNPAALLNLPDTKVAYTPTSKEKTLADRQAHFSENLKLSYADPVMFVRGWKHHLFDEWGRPYLDAYNNVPHVGHAHPRIQAVAADQLRRMNSNTRYLHPAQTAFAEKILSKMPDELSVCFFVNSGTEANELSLRLVRAHTGGKDMITPDHGYHGNTTGAIDISAYKFNAKGGIGQPDWVQLIEVADDYRGRFRRGDPDCAEKYSRLVDDAIAAIEARGGKLAGFIAETFPSVGGQIIPPKGYLAGVYKRIRAAGGVCIADEVQTGLGRLGEYYFGFEQQNAIPDIVVLGKPIGNGHPLGVLVTTREIADSFARGPEYFSTFGGSTLSCRMGKEVLDIVDDEGLMENALAMGQIFLDGLRNLQKKYEVVGDVRGYGLFIGVDLVTNRKTREPGTKIANYVKNRLRENRILIGSEGPFDNILKIRPPLTIAKEDVEMILTNLDLILAEVTALTFSPKVIQ